MAFAMKVQEALTKGFEKAKGFARKANRDANRLASKGVNKFEGAQLRKRVDELIAKLGVEAYSRFVDMDKPELSRSNPAIRELLDAVKGLKSQIALEDGEYKEIDAAKA